jgi:hypothetical protein
MDSCKGAVDFIQNLNWPDPYENAVFLTSLSRVRLSALTLGDREGLNVWWDVVQTISKAVEEYCNILENMFAKEMAPSKSTQETGAEDERTHAWLVKAKGLYQGQAKPEAFTFTPEVRRTSIFGGPSVSQTELTQRGGTVLRQAQ